MGNKEEEGWTQAVTSKAGWSVHTCCHTHLIRHTNTNTYTHAVRSFWPHKHKKTYNTMTILHNSSTILARIWPNIDLELYVLNWFLDRDFTQNNYWLKSQDIEQSWFTSCRSYRLKIQQSLSTRCTCWHASLKAYLTREKSLDWGRVAVRFVQPPSLVCCVLYKLLKRFEYTLYS